jgi:L-ascorbate metabolism protein UlaG (beta-lactamase superfamily)
MLWAALARAIDRTCRSMRAVMKRIAVFLFALFVVADANSQGQIEGNRVPATGGDIVITPLTHASVQIEHAGRVIQVDPWSVGDLSQAKPADLILITDDVGHHLDVKAIAKLRKPGAPVYMPASGQKRIPDGIVLANGGKAMVPGIGIESIAAYDIKPGAPEHPKGEANGYVLSIGGKRIYFAGVTECVPEVLALKNIDVAFMPMNIPVGRMTPKAAAECTKAINPKVVYVYHYDQDFATRAVSATAKLNDGVNRESPDLGIQDFANELKGTSIEFKRGSWYPKK